MAMKKFKCEIERITRKKKRVDYFGYLPDDILTGILLLLPAELLQSNFKYVCKRWFNIITRQILFDQASIILQKPASKTGHVYRTRLVDLNEGISNLRIKEQYLNIPCKGRIRSSCNELLLIMDPCDHGALFIFNLVTKVGSTLPPGSLDCGGHLGCKCGLGLAFDKFKGVYKVIHVFVGVQSVQCEMFVLKCESLFLNRSKWKTVDGPSFVGNRKFYWDDPVSINGRYFYWDVHSAEYIVSMDIVEERFHQIRLPDSINSYFLLEMGGYLCLQHCIYDNDVNIWILKDFQRKEWHRLQSIRDLGSIPSTGYPATILPVPVASFKNGSYIIFKRTRNEIGLFGYKIKDRCMVKLDISIAADERCLAQSIVLGFG